MIVSVYKEMGTYSWVLHYKSDPTPPQSLQPTAAQLSIKSALSPAEDPMAAPDRSNKGPGTNVRCITTHSRTWTHMLIRSCMHEPISMPHNQCQSTCYGSGSQPWRENAASCHWPTRRLGWPKQGQGTWRVFFVALGKSPPNSHHPCLAMLDPRI